MYKGVKTSYTDSVGGEAVEDTPHPPGTEGFPSGSGSSCLRAAASRGRRGCPPAPGRRSRPPAGRRWGRPWPAPPRRSRPRSDHAHRGRCSRRGPAAR